MSEASIPKTIKPSLELFKYIVDNAGEEFYLVWPNGELAYVNETAAKSLGYSRDEMLSIGINGFDPKFGPMYQDHFNDLKKRDVPPFRTKHIAKDGTIIDKEIKSVYLKTDEGEFVCGFGREISQRVKTEEHLQENLNLLALSSDIGQALTTKDSLQHSLQACCKALVNNLNAAFARIWILNKTKNCLELLASAGIYTHTDGNHKYIEISDSTKIGNLALTRKPHLTNQVIGDPQVTDQDWAKREGMVAFAGQPLLVGDEIVGVLGLFSRQELPELTAKGLSAIATQLSIGIQRKNADDQIRMRNHIFQTLTKCNEVLLHATSEGELLQKICELIVDQGGYRMCWIGYLLNDPSKTVNPVAKAGFETEYLHNVKISWGDNEFGQGPTGRAIREMAPVILQDILSDPQYKPWREAAIQRGYASSGAFPLKTSKKIIGVLNIYAKTPSALSDFEVTMLQSLADEMTFGILNLRAREQQQQMEKDLRQSRERFKSLIENISDLIWETDDKGAFTYCSPKIKDILGYDVEEALGKTLFEFMPQDEAKKLAPEFLRLAERKQPFSTLLNRNIHKNGREIIIESSGVPILDSQGNLLGYRGINRDVTFRKEFQEQLAQSEREWADAMDFVEDAILLVDLEEKVIQANSQVYKFTGLSPEEIIGKDINYILHPDHLDAPCSVCRARKECRDAFFTLDKDHPDNPTGNPIEVMVKVIRGETGEPVRILMGIRDLSRLDEIFKQVQIINQTLEAIILTDMQGNVQTWNNGASRIFGISWEEAHGKDLPSILLNDMRPIVSQMLAMAQREDFQEKDCQFFTDAFDPWWALIRTSPLRNNAGNTVGILWAFQDNTERKKLEGQLLQSQKMEAVGRLAGGIAHDFNNLLTTIIGYSELLMMSLPEDHKMQEDLHTILDAGKKATDLVRQLLAFSRKQILEMQVIQVNIIIANLAKMVGRLIGEDIQLEIRAETQEDTVMADQGQIEQIIVNLAVNARDAMPNGGKLIISTDITELDERTAMKTGLPLGSYVLIKVIDNGMGIPQELQEKIFEPFFTTKESGKGTGLGLSTVFGIVKQHNGHIELESEKNRGTTFSIYLPATDASGESLPAKAKPTMPKGKDTILVIDDEPQLLNLLCDTLRPLGYTVLTACSGNEAIELYGGNNSNPIDLLLTDVIMPGMSGKEVAEKFHQRFPNLLIAFMSGYTDEIIAPKGVLESGQILINKPIIPSVITAKIREILDKRLE